MRSRFGKWRSWLARCVRDAEVGCSSHLFPTSNGWIIHPAVFSYLYILRFGGRCIQKLPFATLRRQLALAESENALLYIIRNSGQKPPLAKGASLFRSRASLRRHLPPETSVRYASATACLPEREYAFVYPPKFRAEASACKGFVAIPFTSSASAALTSRNFRSLKLTPSLPQSATSSLRDN